MIIDERNEFADATSVGTPNNTTVNVGNIIDMGAARDIGNGQPLYLVVQVDTAIVGSTSVVKFKLSSDSTTSIAVDGSQTEHATSDGIPEATLVAGFRMVMPLPSGSPDYERYLAFQVEETSGNVLSAGNVSAFLTLDPIGWVSTADANN